MSVKAFEELVQNHAVAAPVRQTTLLLLDKLAENDKDAFRPINVLSVFFAAQATVGAGSQTAPIPLYLLLQNARVSALDFFEQFKSVCSKLSLQPSLLDLLKLLERKYVVSHLLFRKYEKLFNQIVDVSELRVNPVSRGDALKFGWLLFLVAKGRIIPDTIPDLASSLDVLICALSFTFSNWGAVNDPGVASLARHCGCDAEKVQVLKQSLFDPFVFSLLQNEVLASEVISAVDDGRVSGCLSISMAVRNIASLERVYRASCQSLDETLILLSPSPPEGTPARSAFVSQSSALSPHAGLLKSSDWLQSLVRHVSVEEPPKNLVKFFTACNSDTDFLRVSRLLMASVRDRMSVLGLEAFSERFVMVQKIYFVLLETLLQSEEERLQQKGTNFTLLLSNEAFHRSLIWCALEMVFYSFRVDKAFYPHNLSMAGVSALDLIKIIESVLRTLKNLSSVMARRLTDIEEHLLEFYAWKRGDALFTQLQVPGICDALSEWLGSDAPTATSGGEFASHAAASLAPSSSAVAHSSAAFASPARPVRSNTVPLPGAVGASFGTKLFFRKISVLVSLRVKLLCQSLGMAFLIQSQICKTVMHTLLRSQLCFDRHLDQIILCSVYAVGKVYWKAAGSSITGSQEITFKEIVSCYKSMPHYQRLSPAIFREVLMADGSKNSIIEFYNQLFVPELDEFVLRFQTEYSHILGTPQALITPRAMRVADSHDSVSASASSMSFRNVSVSPLKARPAVSPFRSTKLGVGKSPSKELARISESMKGQKSSSSEQSRKRLFPTGAEDDDVEVDYDDDNGDDDDVDDHDDGGGDGTNSRLNKLFKVTKELENDNNVSPTKKRTK